MMVTNITANILLKNGLLAERVFMKEMFSKFVDKKTKTIIESSNDPGVTEAVQEEIDRQCTALHDAWNEWSKDRLVDRAGICELWMIKKES
jgi:hypothetical protein